MAITLEHRTDRNFLEVHASERLTAEDYARFEPVVDRLIAEHGQIRMLFAMENFKGWTAAGLWEDVKFDWKHFDDVERLAIVGETNWQQGMARVCRPFTTAKIKYFEPAQLEDARHWLDGPSVRDAAAREEDAVGGTAEPVPTNPEYEGLVRSVAELDFVPNEAMADAACKAVLGLLVSRMEDSEAREFTEALPEPLTYERLRSHQERPASLTTSEALATVAAQFKLNVEQAERLAVRVIDRAKPLVEEERLKRIAAQMPADWGALLQVA